uniref:Uncharacterized protein n=1 Tax=Entomoneis paludosa TaxID=265537 RepID=A0A7S2Y4E8_9STRA|mmetsp:Transcript_16951/g.35010  ORF Transcript_16951/g.35010 Transcript_16951/m.35010 type:complete len:108 (+) Transcript_16951:53-376(+)
MNGWENKPRIVIMVIVASPNDPRLHLPKGFCRIISLCFVMDGPSSAERILSNESTIGWNEMLIPRRRDEQSRAETETPLAAIHPPPAVLSSSYSWWRFVENRLPPAL